MIFSSGAAKFLHQAPPPIPLIRGKGEIESKNRINLFELKSNPDQENSSTYKKGVRAFRTGSVEEFLEWKRDLDAVIAGQSISTVAGKFAITKRLLEGEPLTHFTNAVALYGETTQTHYNKCMNDLFANVIPKRAARLQRRFMKHVMRKPREWKMRDYVARVKELNSFIKMFPPSNKDESMSDTDILKILEMSVPNSWLGEFAKAGFDPANHDLKEFLERCERIELAESFTGPTNNHSNVEDNQPSKKKQKTTGPRANQNGRSGNKKGHKLGAKSSREAEVDCPLHGPGCGHGMGSCKVLKAQAEKMRAMYQAQSHEQQAESGKGRGKWFLNLLWQHFEQK